MCKMSTWWKINGPKGTKLCLYGMVVLFQHLGLSNKCQMCVTEVIQCTYCSVLFYGTKRYFLYLKPSCKNSINELLKLDPEIVKTWTDLNPKFTLFTGARVRKEMCEWGWHPCLLCQHSCPAFWALVQGEWKWSFIPELKFVSMSA